MSPTAERTPVELCDLSVDHLDAVAAIEAASTPDPWSRELFAGELDLSEEVRTWVVAVEETGGVLGFAGMMFVAEEAHVMNIAVRPDRRRLGLGERMLAELVARAHRRGIDALTLEVRVSNEPARALYRRFGFVEAGRRPRYYGDGEDALILWATDEAAGGETPAGAVPTEEVLER